MHKDKITITFTWNIFHLRNVNNKQKWWSDLIEAYTYNELFEDKIYYTQLQRPRNTLKVSLQLHFVYKKDKEMHILCKYTIMKSKKIFVHNRFIVHSQKYKKKETLEKLKFMNSMKIENINACI